MKINSKAFFSVAAAFALLFTACTNKETGNNDISTNTKINQTSLSGNKKTLDENVEKFTSGYISTYNQKGNAFLKIAFTDIDFVPEEVRNKIKYISLDDENVSFYNLIISLEDDVLFRVAHYKNSDYTERSIDSVYLSKGDCMLISARERMDGYMDVRAYNMNNDAFATETIENYEFSGPYKVAMWKKEELADVFKREFTYSPLDNKMEKMNTSIDLDGDGKLEKIYFYGLRQYAEMNKNISRFSINDREYDLIELGKISGEKDLYYTEDVIDIEIIDINPNDKYKEICFKRTSGVAMYNVGNLYRYDSGELIHMGTLDYGVMNSISNGISGGKVTIRSTGYELLFACLVDKSYVINSYGKLELENKESYEITDYNRRILCELKRELNLYDKQKSDNPTQILEVGDRLIFLESDLKSWIKVKSVNTGLEGYLLFEIDNENYSYKFKNQDELDGMYISEIFFNLPMWG